MRRHGTRVRYVFGEVGNDWRKGCRCFECSQAAVLYEKRRQRARLRGEAAFVDAAEARDHLMWLRSQGVGIRTVCDVTGLSRSSLQKLITGRRSKITSATADKVLGVHSLTAKPGAYIDAGRTLEQIDDLIHQCGMTKGAIAKALGAQTPALQIAKNGRASKRNADKVDRLWRERMAPVLARREVQRERRAMYRRREREAC